MLLILIYRLLLGVNLPKKIERVDYYAGDKALDLFLARTDILICMLPLTDATRDILNLELFRRLKPNAYIMNLGRGEHLVEESKISEKTINPNRIKSLGISSLALPMIVGPAAIVMVILYGQQHTTLGKFLIVGILLLVSISVVVVFMLANYIARALGYMGVIVLTKLMGLIIAAIACEMIVSGLKAVIPVLV